MQDAVKLLNIALVMSDFLHPQSDVLKKIISVIESNLQDEDFGVEELAQAMNMSRSNLLRKVKEKTGVSVSVYMRKVRLFHARKMLQDDSLNASEVSFKVGFNSVSYFTKCFREEFGYTPGDKKIRQAEGMEPKAATESGRKNGMVWTIIGLIVVITVGYWLFRLEKPGKDNGFNPDRSIAVLPFKNDSNDSTNVYIINGLMDAILDNLQKIEDLEVTSRTTVEKYRKVPKSIPELYRELEVNYFVEGSGQKIGNKILLSIQLIDGRTDKHIWSGRFEREAHDIFALQSEVAQAIAQEIQVTITPAEKREIEKTPTDNLVAYDHYLKGLEVKNATTQEELYAAIGHFEDAISEDPNFANAYAYIAICYYYVDLFMADKANGNAINTYADKALLLAPNLPESMIAKGLFYLHDGQYEFAAQHFERVLEESPHSEWVHNVLTDIYTSYIPNTSKYLMHALQGIKVAIADQDSITTSFTYLHLSNALAQSGFLREGEEYALKSLDYNPDNLYTQYLLIYIRLAQNFNLQRAKEELKEVLQQDTTRLDVIQEIAKVYYTTEDYEEAWEYYEKFVKYKEAWQLAIFPGEDVKIGYVLKKLDRVEEANKYFDRFLEYAQNDQTIYADLNMTAYYAATGEVKKGIEYMQKFTEQKDYLYWLVLFLDKDPIMLELSSDPAYDDIVKDITENFWTQHKETRRMLEDQGII